MKFSLALIAPIFVVAHGAPASSSSTFKLSQSDANTLLAQYEAVLKGVNYNGMTPNQTANQILTPDFQEISDSILQLEGKPLGGSSSSGRANFEYGVTAFATPNITTHDVLVAGNSSILWYWTMPTVGNDKYPIKGFILLRVNSNKKIYESDIEFNSIARAIDTNDTAVCTG